MSWWGWALIGNSLIGLSVLLHRRGRRRERRAGAGDGRG